MNNPYKPEPKKILEYTRESSDTFTIKLDWQIKNEPGQFVFCTLPGIGEAPISICSHSQDYIELNIREVGNVTNALGKLKVGDELLVRGVYGTTYPMKDLEGDHLLIAGGGCGVAPLKGVIEYIEQNKEKYADVSLFLGFRTPEDALFSNHHQRWHDAFKLYMSYDKLDHEAGQSCLFGKQAFVTQLLDEEVKDNKGKVALLCGPPIMIEKCVEILRKKGFKDEQIFISAERLMYCGMGKCGRCMIHGKYTCLDGAVFRLDELGDTK